VLTRDIKVTSGSAITIQGSLSVTFDLAGHSIISTSPSAVITIDVGGPGDPCTALTLRNGSIAGSGAGLTTTFGHHCLVDVRVEHVAFNSASVYVEEGSLFVTSSRFTNSDLENEANGGEALVARIEDSDFENGSILLLGAGSAQIHHNTLQWGSIYAQASDGRSPVNHVIDANTIKQGAIRIRGGGVVSDSVGVAITHNVVTSTWSSSPISVETVAGVRIADNLIGLSSLAGISLANTRDALIDNNRVWGCLSGIMFDTSSNDNAYRNNMLRNNTSAVLDNGTGNTDSGGNIK
jgi:hypothetical protein